MSSEWCSQLQSAWKSVWCVYHFSLHRHWHLWHKRRHSDSIARHKQFVCVEHLHERQLKNNFAQIIYRLLICLTNLVIYFSLFIFACVIAMVLFSKCVSQFNCLETSQSTWINCNKKLCIKHLPIVGIEFQHFSFKFFSTFGKPQKYLRWPSFHTFSFPLQNTIQMWFKRQNGQFYKLNFCTASENKCPQFATFICIANEKCKE